MPPITRRQARRANGGAAAAAMGVPDGYITLAAFNKEFNKYDKYSGIKGRVADETDIFVKIFNKKVFLWWLSPFHQYDDFIYTGISQEDIDDCDARLAADGIPRPANHTWHHTGFPHDVHGGTMQLVPTQEHSALSHHGGMAISKGKL